MEVFLLKVSDAQQPAVWIGCRKGPRISIPALELQRVTAGVGADGEFRAGAELERGGLGVGNVIGSGPLTRRISQNMGGWTW